MLPNFFLLDLRSSLWAFALFGLFAFVPGYAVGWTADFIGFRHRTAVTRLVLSVPVSIGVSPLLAYLTSRFGSIALTWFAFGVLWLVFVIILIQEPRSFRLPIDKRSAVCALIVAGWLAIGLFSLVDLSWGNRLYYSVVSYDYSLRSAIVSAISRDGIPPSNPYFFPGHAVPIRYHYSWLIPCALVKQMGGSWVTGRHAIIAGTLWCGIGLMALIVLYLRFVHPDGARRIHRRALLGLALLAVTGLDIIPDLALALVRRPWAEPEWWNEQVAAWITSMLWVPHHLGALIAGFTGVLILWHSAGMDTRRWPALCVAAFCLAGCVGESIYVGFAFGAALAVWTLVTLLKGWKRETGFLIGMGLLALVLAAPQFWELTASVPGGRTTPATIPAGTHILGLGVRHFYPVAGLARASGWPNLVYAAFLPFNYTLEFGFYGLVGVWFLRRAWRRRPAGRYDLLTLTIAATSLLLCTFVRSTLIVNNDLGYRGVLLAQFVLLLWAVDLVDSPKAVRRPLVVLLIALGVASSVYEVASLRFYAVVSDLTPLPWYTWLNPTRDTGHRLYEARAAYQRLNTLLGKDAIVQQNPDTNPGDLPWALYSEQRTVADTPSCNTVLGGDPRQCADIMRTIQPMFQGTATPHEVDRACRMLGISALIVKDTDPVWGIPASWMWRRAPLISGQHIRVFLLGHLEENPQ
ncbi:MAG: hypothetical protein ABSH42_20230 [Bryobacteraceae bacterium]|jgi:hypothetical protein